MVIERSRSNENAGSQGRQNTLEESKTEKGELRIALLITVGKIIEFIF